AAYVSGAAVEIDGALTILAQENDFAEAKAFGVNAGALAVGASKTETVLDSTISATIGGDIIAGSVSVTADHGNLSGDYAAKARSTGSAGALVGVTATSSTTTNTSQVTSSVADNSTLTISGATLIQAQSDVGQVAESTSNSGGLVAAGLARATATSNTAIAANIGSDVILTGDTLAIVAAGDDNNFATAVAGSGGVIAGAAAESITANTSNTTVEFGTNAEISTTSMRALAQHTAEFDAITNSTSAALLGASGASAVNDVDANVDVTFNAGVIVESAGIDIDAHNIINKNVEGVNGYNISAAAGGIASGAAASSSTDIENTTVISVADGAQLVATDGANTLSLTSTNDITAKDLVKLDSGGAISLAKSESTITNDTNINEVRIGAATLTSAGDMELVSLTNAKIEAHANAKTYGLSGYARGDSDASVTAANDVVIEAGATMTADGDMALMAGQNRNGDVNDYTVSARTELWNRTVLPVKTDPQADGVLTQNSTITIENGAWVGSGGDTYLVAEMGEIDVVGKGTGKDLYREALEEFGEVFGGDLSLSIEGGNGDEQYGSADVIAAGTVAVGIHNNRALIVSDASGAWPTSDFDPVNDPAFTIITLSNGVRIATTEGIDYTIDSGSSLLAAIDERIALITEIRDSYEDTSQYDEFDIQIDILNTLRADLDNGTVVDFINVGAIEAASGDIVITANTFTGNGTGELIAPTDTVIEINNNSDYYLRTDDLTIPEYGGGYIRMNYRELRAAEIASLATYVTVYNSTSPDPSITIQNTGTPSIEI
ncbi:MAG: hypothetical protein KAU22_10430, partial [Desulfuromonadales bacterium]|nr:hypothetical protein [Desulfuromonadales bacterium]